MDLTKQMAADAVFMSLEACLNQVEAWVSDLASPAETSPVLADTEQERIAALSHLGLASAADRQFDQVSRTVAQAFDVPIALVSLADPVRHPRHEGPDPASDPNAGWQPAHEPLEAHVVATGEVLVAEDVAEDERFADDSVVLEKGIRFYAGAPLRTSDGVVIGALCIIDTKPREFLEPDQLRLQDMANEFMADLEQRALAEAGQTQGD